MAITIIISLNYSFLSAASISAITRVMIYGIVCITLIVLRKKRPEQSKFFKIKYGKAIAILGVIITLWLLSSSKVNELRDIAISIAIGLVVYLLMEISKRIISKK